VPAPRKPLKPAKEINMMLFTAFNLILKSTIVRFSIFLLPAMLGEPAVASEWRRDSVRELQVAERIYQWQQRGHFGAQYCWQPLRIDDSQSVSRPGVHLLAAHPSRSDQQLRADYVRQQFFCLLTQQPAIRHAAIEQLRRRVPNLAQINTDETRSVTERYSDVLASQLAYQWMAQQGEWAAAQSAQQDWRFWAGARAGERPVAWHLARPLGSNDLYARLLPTATNWAKR
jgi:hypothetical protein